MNTLGACKAVLRGRLETAEGLLSRGFQRIGEHNPAGGLAHRIAALVDAAAAQEPRLRELASDMHALLRRRSNDFPQPTTE
ncbi:hypothetical protein AB0I53_01170 [Saccharopolyspora sp. NPDC050389]|uniref:hypothetical protein n=1 Tax=Saccharopolyspora sp. NPDC050389 TaxID=3155516 RepID=UPI0033ED4CA7